jgi:hypothetical protein
VVGKTKIGFSILDTNDCKTIELKDKSFFPTGVACEQVVLQIITPYKKQPVELPYIVGGIITLNSNNLEITCVEEECDLQDLPDGLYTAKISQFPHELVWYERQFFRVCKLECAFHKAVLKLGLGECRDCYDPHLKQKLDIIWYFIQGVKTNANIGRIANASDLYASALKELKTIIGEDNGCNC